jgi:hypothetical protein
MEIKWIEAGMPDYDGRYLCHIVRRNECGTFSEYQKVVEVRKAQWMLEDEREMVAYYTMVPGPNMDFKLVQS